MAVKLKLLPLIELILSLIVEQQHKNDSENNNVSDGLQWPKENQEKEHYKQHRREKDDGLIHHLKWLADEINYDTDNDDNENDVDDRDDQKIEHENLDTIDILLSKCLIIATTDYDSGWNDFDSNINAHGENMKIIEILLQYGADPNYRNCHVVRLLKTLGMIKLLFADKTKHKLNWLQALGKVTIRPDEYRTEGKTSKFSLILKWANVSEGVKILKYLLDIKEARMLQYIDDASETKDSNNNENTND